MEVLLYLLHQESIAVIRLQLPGEPGSDRCGDRSAKWSSQRSGGVLGNWDGWCGHDRGCDSVVRNHRLVGSGESGSGDGDRGSVSQLSRGSVSQRSRGSEDWSRSGEDGRWCSDDWCGGNHSSLSRAEVRVSGSDAAGSAYLIDGDCGGVFGLDAGLVRVDVCSEAECIGHVVHCPDSAISVPEAVRTNNLTQSITLFSSESATRGVVLVVSEVVVASDLRVRCSDQEQSTIIGTQLTS